MDRLRDLQTTIEQSIEAYELRDLTDEDALKMAVENSLKQTDVFSMLAEG